MRIGIIGAGAMGGTLAVLAARDHDVRVTARGAHLDAIRRDGLRLSGAFGELHAAVRADATLDERPDLAVVSVKAHDAVDAVRANREALEGVPLLVIQNGIGGASGADAVLGTNAASGIAVWAAMIERPGTIFATADGGLGIGGPGAERFLALFSPYLPVEAITDLAGAQWTKLLINMVNALPAITGWSVQQTIAYPALRSVLVEAMRECLAVATASGIRLAPLQGMTARRAALLRGPDWLAARLPLAMAARMGAVPNYGSTLQSILRNVPTEIDALHGAVVQQGESVGVPTPVCRALVALVHDVEQRGAFLLPGTIVARARLGA